MDEQDPEPRLAAALTAPQVADITSRTSLVDALKGASVVVSLVGVLHGDQSTFEKIQWKGVKNIVDAIVQTNAEGGSIKKVIHFSAIGADLDTPLDYFRTKALAEKELFTAFGGSSGPSVTVFRPSLVFGPGDGFFQVITRLSECVIIGV